MSEKGGSSVSVQKCKAAGEPLSWPVKCKGFPEGDCQAYVSDHGEFVSHMMGHWIETRICPVCSKQKAVKISPEGKLLISKKNFKAHLEYHLGRIETNLLSERQINLKEIDEKSKVDFNKNKKVSFNIVEPPITPITSAPVPPTPTKDPTSVNVGTNSSLKWTVQQVSFFYFPRFFLPRFGGGGKRSNGNFGFFSRSRSYVAENTGVEEIS